MGVYFSDYCLLERKFRSKCLRWYFWNKFFRSNFSFFLFFFSSTWSHATQKKLQSSFDWLLTSFTPYSTLLNFDDNFVRLCVIKIKLSPRRFVLEAQWVDANDKLWWSVIIKGGKKNFCSNSLNQIASSLHAAAVEYEKCVHVNEMIIFEWHWRY